jgi:hypothetical protein
VTSVTWTLDVGACTLPELAMVLAGFFESFQSVVRWHTALDRHWQSRTQEVRARRDFGMDPGGFSGTVVCEAGGVLTNSSRFVPPFSMTHLEALSSRWSTLLVMSASSRIDPSDVCDLLGDASARVDEVTIDSVTRAHPELLVARVSSHEGTVSVIQLFGHEKEVRRRETYFLARGVERVRHRDDVAAWIAEACIGSS